MKRSTKLIVAFLVVVAALAVTYRLMHRVPSADLEANVQMQQIITDAGCLRCHTSTPELPFYANMPVAGKIVMEDVSKAYRAFDMTQMEKDMKEGRPLNPVDLAKVEKVILDGKMPQAKYYLVHWGASFNDAKKEVALSWVKNHRMGLYTDVAVAPDFINEPIRPIADSISVDVRKVVLGNLLYHDTRLSADNTVSCASCHGLDTGGVDNKQYSEGVGGQLGGVNAPTVYNAAYNFVQFWDGRAGTLAEQAAGPPLNPVEMACESFDQIISKLAEDKNFVVAFNEVYPDGLSEKNITNAIQEFEKTLLTPNSRFDRYLKGHIMRKPSFEQFETFKKIFDRINREENLRQQLIPYFISSHPGCNEEDMAELAVITKRLDFHLEQVQDFTPTPMTVATEAWYSGFHPYTLEPIFSAKTQREKLAQRQFFFWYKPEERKNIINELRRIGRSDLIDKLYGKRKDMERGKGKR